MREFTALGLLDDVRRLGVEIQELRYLTRYGREIWREPRGTAAGYAWPQVAIHRGELQMLLLSKVLERLGPDAVKFDRSLTDLELHEGSVTAQFHQPCRRGCCCRILRPSHRRGWNTLRCASQILS